jgi:hypothetical protein
VPTLRALLRGYNRCTNLQPTIEEVLSHVKTAHQNFHRKHEVRLIHTPKLLPAMLNEGMILFRDRVVECVDEGVPMSDESLRASPA